MEAGSKGRSSLFTAGKLLSDRNPLSPFLLGYLHLFMAKMVNCTQANCSPYGLISFGRSVWQNAGENMLQHANQTQ